MVGIYLASEIIGVIFTHQEAVIAIHTDCAADRARVRRYADILDGVRADKPSRDGVSDSVDCQIHCFSPFS